jgi:hypothetical protein
MDKIVANACMNGLHSWPPAQEGVAGSELMPRRMPQPHASNNVTRRLANRPVGRVRRTGLRDSGIATILGRKRLRVRPEGDCSRGAVEAKGRYGDGDRGDLS